MFTAENLIVAPPGGCVPAHLRGFAYISSVNPQNDGKEQAPPHPYLMEEERQVLGLSSLPKLHSWSGEELGLNPGSLNANPLTCKHCVPPTSPHFCLTDRSYLSFFF